MGVEGRVRGRRTVMMTSAMVDRRAVAVAVAARSASGLSRAVGKDGNNIARSGRQP